MPLGLRTTNYLGIMSIKWGVDFYNSEAHVYTRNWILRRLCRFYLKLRGFKEIEL